MFELTGITKRFGQHVALDALDLRITAGRTTALLGVSGCGKSTLLRLMIGLLTPDAGEILFEGQRLAPATLQAQRQRIGYVIQEGGLFPHLTARGNVTLVARHLGWTQARIAARLNELLELTRLSADLLARYPQELSGGQRQRVALMRALMLDPPALLLDEPLGALDPLVRRELQEELRALFARLQKTVVLVTHDLHEAAFLADLIVLLRDGRIVQQAALAELLHRPAEPFVTRFVQAQRGSAELTRAANGSSS